MEDDMDVKPPVPTAVTAAQDLALEDQEESVRIAVKALGDMRNMHANGSGSRSDPQHSRTSSSSNQRFNYDYDDYDYDAGNKLPPIKLPPLSPTSSGVSRPSTSASGSTSGSSASASASAAAEPSTTSPNAPATSTTSPNAPAFVSRMTHLPLVTSALRAYEHTKASSRVVKYGAAMVESGVKTLGRPVMEMSRPVMERLPVAAAAVEAVDGFACRQLDRLDKYTRPSTSGDPNGDPNSTSDAGTSTGGDVHPNPDTNLNAQAQGPSPADRDRGRPRPKLRPRHGDGEEDGDKDMDDESQHERERDRESGRNRERRERYGAGGGRSVPKWLEATSPFVAPPPPPPPDSSLPSSPSSSAAYGYGYGYDYEYGSPRSASRMGSYSRSSTPTREREREGGSERARSSSSYALGQSGNAHGTTPMTDTNAGGAGAVAGGSERQVAQRSRWQAMLLEAGGLSAALSEESMRRLKYCLQWLQYATAHIDAQILILRDFTASLQAAAAAASSSPSSPSSTLPRPRPPISEEHMRKLTDMRRDIVHTIRQVVDVVSKYAGGALPEPARGRVRGFILKLPQRWASRAGVGSAGGDMMGEERERERDVVAAAAGSGTGVVRRAGGQRRAAQRERGVDSMSGLRSGASSVAVSPSSSPRITRASLGSAAAPGSSAAANGSGSSGTGGQGGGGQTVSATAALVASQRILTLATESLDMMRNVTSVVKDSLDRADAWVGRLRTVGIQRADSDSASAIALENPGANANANGDGEGDGDMEGSLIVPSDSATVASSREAGPQRERGKEDFEFEFSDRMRYRSHSNSQLTSNSNSNSQLNVNSQYGHGRGYGYGYGYTHSRNGSTQSDSVHSSFDIDMEVDGDGDGGSERVKDRDAVRGAGDRSPYFSAASSTAWGSSIPSTPGAGASVHPALPMSPVRAGAGAGNGNGALQSGISAMRIGSRYGTPKSGVVGLPEDDEEGGGVKPQNVDVLVGFKGDLKGRRLSLGGEEEGKVKLRTKDVAAMRQEEEEMDVDC
ncbi:hypothetical protein JR316_0008491 [Psilocybe cubensis]|uniref:Opi1-domain-containing protein n=2 Tax=Psilocybe cubensis TaxID=181762 RepID=A0A8H7XJJ9_PSICU|nr:hypothetical protein JR316_0008491 [Psilocybe cubensis]KAH9479895.1 hypothetical protein JR316_0008491 [Psilocybe cubensis]